MNIGLFTDSYLPEISGLTTSISTLKTELKKRGHNVYIFTTSNPVAGKKMRGVFRLPSMPFIFFKDRRLGVFYMPRASKCVKRLKLDIIHTQTEFGIGIFGKIMAKQQGLPVVHTYHTMYEDYFYYITKGKFKNLSDDIVRVLTRRICNACEAVVAPTKKVSDLLLEYGVEKPINIIPTGIDLTRFKKENYNDQELLKTRESLGIKKGAPVILFLGRVAKEKSIDVILKQMPKVLEKMPNAKFLIVGGGPQVEDIKDLAEILKIEGSVIFAGEKPWEEIGKYYRLGDVFVSCSVTETQGLTLIEAMASNVPVVARKDRNIETLIQNNVNGRIINTENELSEVIVEILSNKELAYNLVLNANKTVEEYSAEQFGLKIERVYNEVLKNYKKVKKKGYRGIKTITKLKNIKSLKSFKNIKKLHAPKAN